MSAFHKSTSILAIIMDELNVPSDATFGDIMYYLSFFDDDGEITKMLAATMKEEVIAEIKRKLKERRQSNGR